MSWAKLDDQYPDHPKIIEVGPLGMALHTAAICYCARYLTDGFVPAAMITRLINLDGIQTINNGVSNAVTHKEVIDNLTRVGLLEVVQGGYMIHDFLKYNPKGEDVKRERAENAARQAAWKAKHGSNGVSNNGNNRVPSPSPIPSPSKKKEESARSLVPNAQAAKIFIDVTGWMAIPSSQINDVTYAIEQVMATQENPTAYLRPYWERQKELYPDSTKTFFLEWALSGNMPTTKPIKNGSRTEPNPLGLEPSPKFD